MDHNQLLAASQSTIGEDLQSITIEHLRLHVPEKYKSAWLYAEKRSWEPWLQKQSGFLGRQMFWDPIQEQAILLISWESRVAWKNIPQEDINDVQKSFEILARERTGKTSGNPFPIEFEGELIPQ